MSNKSRSDFEAWYCVAAFDYIRDPIGSHRCGLQWEAWQASRRATLEEAAPKWMPIETAPVAKPVLLLWRPIDHAERPRFQHSIVIGSLEYDPVTYLSNGIVWANGMTYDIATQITGWMPLPDIPPEAGEQSAAAPKDNRP